MSSCDVQLLPSQDLSLLGCLLALLTGQGKWGGGEGRTMLSGRDIISKNNLIEDEI